MIFLLFLIFQLWIVWSIYAFFAYRKQKVEGLTILITGGASGIGLRMAKLFAKKGANLVIWDLFQGPLDRAAEEIRAVGGSGSIRTFAIDVTHRHRVLACAKEVGDADIIIQNAGIVTGIMLLDAPEELMEKTMQVNAIAHFWTMKAFLPSMLQRNAGHFVTIASAAGLTGVCGQVDYSASKWAAIGALESLRFEIRKQKKNVSTTVVCPYYINTGMFDGVTTRFPFLFPILDQDVVAERIVRGIQYREEHINIPSFLNLLPITRLLPTVWFCSLMECLGISHTMDAFTGRNQNPKSKYWK